MIKTIRLCLLFLVALGIGIFPVSVALADQDSSSDSEISITLLPKDILFDINNMKPGDWAPRKITVKNSGIKDFAYHMQLRNDGQKKLFNELLLEIKTGKETLYQGKLAAFDKLPARSLASGSKEDLDITVRFPEHLGNDFQGLKSTFAFIFTAEGKDKEAAQAISKGMVDSGGGPTSAGPHLPDTSTNLFNIILFGSILVMASILMMVVRHFRRPRIEE
ncbi:hypothetical protein ACFSMW_16475 [Virgibacillus halophilus]|uniref:LPXTG-motif cell wall anchor domain-containing protein n=1 Tax=Tigheibacillus halophilus TaxID=361280 RepID=A0ABU5C3J9_9BACI|nr:hypothetical protein [Virgibacillus halophilus]